MLTLFTAPFHSKHVQRCFMTLTLAVVLYFLSIRTQKLFADKKREIEYSRALPIKIQSYNGFAGHHIQPPLMVHTICWIPCTVELINFRVYGENRHVWRQLSVEVKKGFQPSLFFHRKLPTLSTHIYWLHESDSKMTQCIILLEKSTHLSITWISITHRYFYLIFISNWRYQLSYHLLVLYSIIFGTEKYVYVGFSAFTEVEIVSSQR